MAQKKGNWKKIQDAQELEKLRKKAAMSPEKKKESKKFRKQRDSKNPHSHNCLLGTE